MGSTMISAGNQQLLQAQKFMTDSITQGISQVGAGIATAIGGTTLANYQTAMATAKDPVNALGMNPESPAGKEATRIKGLELANEKTRADAYARSIPDYGADRDATPSPPSVVQSARAAYEAGAAASEATKSLGAALASVSPSTLVAAARGTLPAIAGVFPMFAPMIAPVAATLPVTPIGTK